MTKTRADLGCAAVHHSVPDLPKPEVSALPRTKALRRALRGVDNPAAAADLLYLERWEAAPRAEPGIALRIHQLRRANPDLAAEIRDELRRCPRLAAE